MTIREQIVEQLDENQVITFADGFDDAIIGLSYNESEPRVVYSFVKGMEVLMKDMSEEDAVDYIHYNVMIQGENYPIWVMDYYVNSGM